MSKQWPVARRVIVENKSRLLDFEAARRAGVGEFPSGGAHAE